VLSLHLQGVSALWLWPSEGHGDSTSVQIASACGGLVLGAPPNSIHSLLRSAGLAGLMTEGAEKPVAKQLMSYREFQGPQPDS
jgi:hypothetical protein